MKKKKKKEKKKWLNELRYTHTTCNKKERTNDTGKNFD